MTTDPWQPPDWRVEVPALRTPPRAARLWRRRDLLAAIATTVGVALLGAPVGLVWSASSAQVDVQRILDSGSEQAFGVQFAADAHFFVIAVVMGLLTAVVAAVLGRRHGPGVAIGLAVGGLVAALVAARVGYLARHDGLVAELGRLDVPSRATSLLSFRLRATGALVVWPIVAVALFAVATLVRWVEPVQPVAAPEQTPATWPPTGPGSWPPGQPHGWHEPAAGTVAPPPPS